MELIELTKSCTKCGKRKNWLCFYKANNKDGLRNSCKLCASKFQRKYNFQNKKYLSECSKKYYYNNKKRIKKRHSENYSQNKKKIAIRHSKYRTQNKERIAKYMKKHNEKPEVKKRKSEYNKKRRMRPEVKAMISERLKNKGLHDYKFNLNRRMSTMVRSSVKYGKNGLSWTKLVGYTVEDLTKRLKRTIPKGYTWNDFLKKDVLHIDHKIPKSVFNFTKPSHEDFKKCWALKNLRLLPARENIIKSDKLVKHFQPSLLI